MTLDASNVPGAATADAFYSLVDILGDEQRLLERLRFTLAQGAMLMAAGETRFLAAAAEDIEATGWELGLVEIRRALIVAEVADWLDLDDDHPTLHQLTNPAPEALRPVLHERRAELQRLSAEIGSLNEVGRELSAAGADQIRNSIERLERAWAASV